MTDIDPTTPAPTCWSCLRYDDASRAIRFLVDGFGFEERLVVPGTAERPVPHAELIWPLGGGVMLGSSSSTEGVHTDMASGQASTYCVCDDPDVLLAGAKGLGAEVVQDIEDTDYGSRGFTVRDFEGNLWSFGTYRGSPRA